MTKKALVGAGILVVLAGGVVFYFLRAHRGAPSGGTNEKAQLGATTSPVQALGVSEKSSPLYQEAMRILDEPFIPAKGISNADAAFAHQKIQEAVDMLRANYNYANPWYDLGAYRKLIGDYQGAIDAWGFVPKIRPDDFVAYHDLGDLYAFTLRNYAKGEANFLASLRNNPQNVDAYSELTTIYEHLDTAKIGQVPALLLAGIKANPQNKNLLILLGEYYASQGDVTSAKKYLNQALQLDPSNSDIQQEIRILTQ